MHDDFQPDFDSFDELDGATPHPFPRLFVAGENGSEAHADAAALAAALADGARQVADPEAADLIVTGSAPDGAPGRATLDPSDRLLLEGSRCPVAVATRGMTGREDYELRRIAVGIDGGRGAAVARDTAIRLAVDHHARLRLIAVAELGFDLGGSARHPDPRELERLARHLEHAGDGLAGIAVETELRTGLADQIILGLARDADLLVLGSRAAYGNAGRVVLGDVAARILRSAPCPTVVVPAA
ncbi:MAG: universal stress protein [Actinobacteria bacterium]|nr:universal stress protein [Actinomycetota bacterium]